MDKQRRHEIYVEALKCFRENRGHDDVYNGMCLAIALVRRGYEPSPYDRMESYPEIYRHSPKHMYKDTTYWWSVKKNSKNRKRRIGIFEQAIKETE